MIFLRRVVGESMTPTLIEGRIVVCRRTRKYRVGHLVVAFVDNREVIKRIAKVNQDGIYLEVDDKRHAHAGAYYAVVSPSHITGVVIWPRGL
jgi:SOS-response transcriptional repressor LexA